jgi:hypothetical protein
VHNTFRPLKTGSTLNSEALKTLLYGGMPNAIQEERAQSQLMLEASVPDEESSEVAPLARSACIPAPPLSATNKSRIADHTYSLLSNYYNKTHLRKESKPKEDNRDYSTTGTAAASKKIVVTFDLVPGQKIKAVENPEAARQVQDAYMVTKPKLSSRNMNEITALSSSKSSRLSKAPSLKRTEAKPEPLKAPEIKKARYQVIDLVDEENVDME